MDERETFKKGVGQDGSTLMNSLMSSCGVKANSTISSSFVLLLIIGNATQRPSLDSGNMISGFQPPNGESICSQHELPIRYYDTHEEFQKFMKNADNENNCAWILKSLQQVKLP